MKVNAFSVRDVKTGLYSPPFFARTRGEAQRSVQTAAADPKTTLAQFPSDFELFEIGYFDDETGQLTVDSIHPQHMIRVADLIATS